MEMLTLLWYDIVNRLLTWVYYSTDFLYYAVVEPTAGAIGGMFSVLFGVLASLGGSLLLFYRLIFDPDNEY